MAVRFALRHPPSFHACKRCRLLLPVDRPSSPRYSSDFSHLREEMVSRQLPNFTDHITATQTRSLNLTLQDFVPQAPPRRVNQRGDKSAGHALLNPTHHLVYFPSVQAASHLLPDGTDTLHSPGPPFTRRMWAGGAIAFLQDIQVKAQPYHCTESIQDVQVRGAEGEEKVFVKLRRVIYAGRYPNELKRQHPGEAKYERNLGLRVREHRTLVFMRDNRKEDSSAVDQPAGNVLKPEMTPEFSHTMIPTRELLFRFSALTFNAHAIHLDKSYCREVEGYRNLLVQGPLTVVLMVEVLRTYLLSFAESGTLSLGSEKIDQIEYRNLAPLYAEEEMRICVRRRSEKSDQEGRTITWDVWIEGLDGGYAAKGTVRTSRTQSRHFRSGVRLPVAWQKGGLEEESIPGEHVALQRATNARSELVSHEDSNPEEDGYAEGNTELGSEEEVGEGPGEKVDDKAEEGSREGRV